MSNSAGGLTKEGLGTCSTVLKLPLKYESAWPIVSQILKGWVKDGLFGRELIYTS